MPYREFTDGSGTEWRAWETRPGAGANVRSSLASGWLSFECPEERRRLSPVPDGWAEGSDDALRGWLLRAETSAGLEAEAVTPGGDDSPDDARFGRTQAVIQKAQQVLRRVEDTLRRSGR